MITLIGIFVMGELLFAVFYYTKAYMAYREQLRMIKMIGLHLRNADESGDIRPELADNIEKNSAAQYLQSCAYHGQLIDAQLFSKLLSEKISKSFQSIQSTANTLPIIGLMGTFLGIIIGVYNIDLSASETAEFMKPLINSAGLAFISSFFALVMAVVLILVLNEHKKQAGISIENTEKNLLIYYLPQVSSTNTEQRFALSVRKLEVTIRRFFDNFDLLTKEFISQFTPLVEEQTKTSQHIDNVACKLEENARILTEVSTVSAKLSDASDALQASVKLASENLNEFIKLGENMQSNIGKMHEPLKDIIVNQKGSIDAQQNLYKDLDVYNKDIKLYLNNLNAKLDHFSAVGNKVHEVRNDFDNFSKELNSLLKQMAEQAQRLQNDLVNSFGVYDKNIRSLFEDITQSRRDAHITYYDPKVMEQLIKAYADNQTILNNMERNVKAMGASTEKLINMIETLRGWGIYRVKQKKKEKKTKVKGIEHVG